MTLEDMLVRIEPFRREILSLLQPFEISKLSRATRCKLSEWEQKTYMKILNDIFEDTSIIGHMVEAGMTVRILGPDIKRLQMRLEHPPAYSASPTPEYHLFVLVSDHAMGSANTATLVRDYRRSSEQGFVPDDLSLVELHTRFDSSIATQIANFSRWILCAPYLAGSMPNMVPGWIHFLSTRPQIRVRTYILTYNDCNGKILHMNHSLTRQLFGIETNKCLLADPSNLSTYCLKMNRSGTIVERLKGNFTISFLHNLLEETPRRGEVQFVIVHTLNSSNCSITINP